MEYADRIPFFQEMIEDEQMNDEEDVPVPQFSKEVFQYVIDYCELLDQLPAPKIEFPLKDYWFFKHVHKDFQNFCEKPRSILVTIMQAADYLKMEDLLNLIGCRIACHMWKRADEDKREYLGIPQDLSDDQIKEIREENLKLEMYVAED